MIPKLPRTVQLLIGLTAFGTAAILVMTLLKNPTLAFKRTIFTLDLIIHL